MTTYKTFFPLEKKTRHDSVQDKNNSDSFFLLTKTLSAARSIQVASTEGYNFMVIFEYLSYQPEKNEFMNGLFVHSEFGLKSIL